ncbi:MAG: autoinducer binding domain-containing protein [Pseudomonadota bacterium]|nr:autoinducer binding domain-containing protein [Pseudomonadota bacterium]
MQGGRLDGTRIGKALAEIAFCMDAREVIGVLSRYAERFGFATVGLGHIVNPQLSAVRRENLFQLSTWRKEWTDYWAGNNLIMRDPVARYSLYKHKPFRWSEAFANDLTEDKKVERVMRDFGFRDGISFPMHTDGLPPGAVSLGADRFELSETELGELHLVCVHAYAKIEELYGSFPYQSPVKLTVREREILHYVAGGKTNWEIGAILEISQHSVRDHLKAACEKLDAVGRAHAVAIALRLGLILP